MKRKILALTLIITASAGLLLLASIPNFSTKANDKNFWYLTEDEITVNETVHDFGIIKESAGSVSATFIITNNTKEPVVLTRVTSSCGCTVPKWTKEPIESGKSAEVTATFNPQGRPGLFDKSISITTTGYPKQLVVRIKGTVE